MSIFVLVVYTMLQVGNNIIKPYRLVVVVVLLLAGKFCVSMANNGVLALIRVMVSLLPFLLLCQTVVGLAKSDGQSTKVVIANEAGQQVSTLFLGWWILFF